MSQNRFQFEDNFYEQRHGTAMGNSLSPFMANLFMSHFETEFKRNAKYFPKVWIRYVDDIFAIFNTDLFDLDEFLVELNSKFPTIKFTIEKENKDRLPFLDVLVIRNNNNLEIDIFRKDTNVNKFITADSNHSFQQKMASFNFLIHRLLSFPLTKDRYQKELSLIKDIARYNGYSSEIVASIIRKHKLKKQIHDSTCLLPQRNQGVKFATLPFHSACKNLNRIFKEKELQVAFKSSTSLKNVLGNTKDKIESNQKSGIYEINCKNCNQKYVGQTKRSISTRYKEHIAHFRFNRPEKSSVARHIWDTGHGMPADSIRLIKTVNNYRELDSFESIYMFKNKNSLMNSDNGPIPQSSLYELL